MWSRWDLNPQRSVITHPLYQIELRLFFLFGTTAVLPIWNYGSTLYFYYNTGGNNELNKKSVGEKMDTKGLLSIEVHKKAEEIAKALFNKDRPI